MQFDGPWMISPAAIRLTTASSNLTILLGSKSIIFFLIKVLISNAFDNVVFKGLNIFVNKSSWRIEKINILQKMVFYFTSDVVSPPVKLFMGLDKFESE